MKKYILIIGLSAMLAVIGLVSLIGSNSRTQAVEYIGFDKAKAIAIADSDVDGSIIKDVEVDLDNKNGAEYYEVDFKVEGKEYDYFIDALTGAIIEARKPNVESATASQKPKVDSDAINQELEETPTKTPAPEPSTPAKQEIVAAESTPEPAAIPAPAQVNPAQPGIISEADAKQKVLERVPGASQSDFVKFHLDLDDGSYEYEGELVYGEMEYEFEIDAYSGSFRDWDAESVYDD